MTSTLMLTEEVTTEHTEITEKIFFYYSQLSLRALCTPWFIFSFYVFINPMGRVTGKRNSTTHHDQANYSG